MFEPWFQCEEHLEELARQNADRTCGTAIEIAAEGTRLLFSAIKSARILASAKPHRLVYLPDHDPAEGK